ncbi:MAG: hypothetical protein KZQ73_01840 [Candidatus Thiodiazotropha sp. (ex Semelilucina semeliformis)]|nr:hypothetical protein [Candidatus Thiodiazotropha sp. (ex Myrtea spinifera)]MCU7806602.1 hypothetical protein [Candidatus Thiodiazotropha sp. (ex Semelilucina semeliformis)]MCU7829323.1 hypothetical protein [Candidatus Thiodiazotropha sp. (ex Myrtea sp. 'scaly one' KF741663)]
MRKSNAFIVCIFLLLVGFTATLIDAGIRRHQAASENESGTALVQQLGLTDLVLFTEARYTRHPSQSDLHSAFQDHPMALEHFPSGSLLLPPQRMQ